VNREWLLTQMHGYRQQIMEVLEGATEAELHHEPAPGRWSAAGILRHLMDFEDDLLRGLDDMEAGREPFWRAISDWNQHNAERAAQWASHPIDDVRAAFVAHRSKLEERLMSLTDEQLATGLARALSPAAVHDFEHIPSLKERLAIARGNKREAVVRYAEIGRNELLSTIFRLPEAALEERVEGKWSIKEILLHLAGRDRHWAKVIRAVSAGAPEPAGLTPAEQEAWNQADVGRGAHYSAFATLYELGEARGHWISAMLAVPDQVAESEAFGRWATMRMKHDRHHLQQIVERWTNWRKRNQG